MTQKVNAKLKYLRIAPRKVRFLANLIRSLSANEAEARLMLSRERSAQPLLKLLKSAIANAKNNHKLDPSSLLISEIRVDQGPKYKRWTPRARGSVSPIIKRTSHVTLVLEKSEKAPVPKFTIVEKPKKGKRGTKGTKEKKPKPEKEIVEFKKTAPEKGFFRKVFRRKVI